MVPRPGTGQRRFGRLRLMSRVVALTRGRDTLSSRGKALLA